MKENYLVIIDVQNDFVTGSLGTPEARAIAADIARKAEAFSGTIVFTKDTHGEDYLETQEGKQLPVPHCIRGTAGWQLIPELERIREQKNARVFEKNTFGSVELARFLTEKYREKALGSVELIGLCTDICVVSNALLLKACMPELPVMVDASCCAGVSPARHEAALQTMESCQILMQGR